MNVMDLGLDDEVIEDTYAKEWITEWDRSFCLGLINFPNMTPKQEQKAQMIVKKIERRARQSVRQSPGQPAEQGNFCSHCGHPLAT